MYSSIELMISICWLKFKEFRVEGQGRRLFWTEGNLGSRFQINRRSYICYVFCVSICLIFRGKIARFVFEFKH